MARCLPVPAHSTLHWHRGNKTLKTAGSSNTSSHPSTMAMSTWAMLVAQSNQLVRLGRIHSPNSDIWAQGSWSRHTQSFVRSMGHSKSGRQGSNRLVVFRYGQTTQAGLADLRGPDNKKDPMVKRNKSGWLRTSPESTRDQTPDRVQAKTRASFSSPLCLSGQDRDLDPLYVVPGPISKLLNRTLVQDQLNRSSLALWTST
jgi:hypothetical protein